MFIEFLESTYLKHPIYALDTLKNLLEHAQYLRFLLDYYRNLHDKAYPNTYSSEIFTLYKGM